MQRKLVSFDVFETIEKNSSLNTYSELSEATDILAKSLDINLIGVHCYDTNSVVYECANGTFIKASYNMNNNQINFSNIEEIVIDEKTEEDARKQAISEMVDALGDNETDKAELSWDKLKVMLERVMKRGRAKKCKVDMYDDNFKKMGKMDEGMVFVRHGAKDVKKAMAAKRGWAKRHHKEPGVRAKMKNRLEMYRANRRRMSNLKKKAKSMQGSGFARAYYTRTSKNKVNEWTTVLENFYTYLDTTSPNDSVVNYNDKGEVSTVVVPTKQARNEAKVIKIKLDTLKTDVKILRENAHKIVNTPDFAKAVAQLKRFNNISDNEGLEECINAIIVKYPDLLGLTQDELAKSISEALEFANETNYDDQTCQFMSEGILRTCYSAFPEKAANVLRLSETKETGNEDAYLDFQTRVSEFYSKLDESIAEEIKLTSDIYNAISEIGSIAENVQDNNVKSDVSLILSDLEPAIEARNSDSLDLVESAAEWLMTFMESNLDSENGWGYVNDPETTITGDGAGPKKNSAFAYSPKSDLESGEGSHQISYDNMNMNSKDGRDHGWGNVDGSDAWDRLSNPYLPKSVKYVGPKGESDDVDSGDALGSNDASGETWNNDVGLKNVYLPKNLIPRRPDMGESDKWSK